jgi:hypothetical protein
VLKAFLDGSFSKVENIYICTCYACFIRRILVALNAIKTIDNEMINLTKLRSLSIVWIAFDATEIRRIKQALHLTRSRCKKCETAMSTSPPAGIEHVALSYRLQLSKN